MRAAHLDVQVIRFGGVLRHDKLIDKLSERLGVKTARPRLSDNRRGGGTGYVRRRHKRVVRRLCEALHFRGVLAEWVVRTRRRRLVQILA